jgi:hypothetical protein
MGQRPNDILPGRQLPPVGEHFRGSEPVHFDLAAEIDPSCGDYPALGLLGAESRSAGLGSAHQPGVCRDRESIRHARNIIGHQSRVVPIRAALQHLLWQQ